jgi:hypothetical protein
MKGATTWVDEQVAQWQPAGVDWDPCECGEPRCRHDVHARHCGIRFKCEGFRPADQKG